MVNKVTLLGNLGADPEFKTLENGNAIASFSVATTETWKDKDGTKHEETEWHRVAAFNRLFSIVRQHVKKVTHTLLLTPQAVANFHPTS